MEQTDVSDETAYERTLTVKAVVSLGVVAVVILIRQRYRG